MIDFGLVDAVDAEAIGQPGLRRFRVRVRAAVNYAALWMEKEQLAALGRACSQLLAERSRARGRRADPAPEMGAFPQNPQVELGIVRIGLDFDGEHERVILVADDNAALLVGDTPAFRMEITRAMAMALIDRIPGIVASGRPLCPLCGQALGDGAHFCPGSNGHSLQPLPTAEQDGDEEDGEDRGGEGEGDDADAEDGEETDEGTD
ncbi:MAG: DUF3090 family protein [Dehalococcoidia bacterium]|nr:DUF3090 family protein [Dehalococcoidia bacterium]